MVLNETFGVSGTAQAYFGGEWWIVGLLLIMIFMLYFYSKGISGEGIAIFLFSSILLITIDGLFTISDDLLMTFIVFILTFLSFGLYKIITR